jgi:hypothetical protein
METFMDPSPIGETVLITSEGRRLKASRKCSVIALAGQAA